MINTVIFDLGGVLIDWDPVYLYQKIFDDIEEREYFLAEICSPDWNQQQDAGRSLKHATESLATQHPEYEKQINAFYGRWQEMLGGAVEDSVKILEQIHNEGRHKIFALTNWSAETFPYALEQYEFLELFEGILVSGQENLKKPDPEIYRLLLERYQIRAQQAVFIDDSVQNVTAARELNISSVHFQSSEQLAMELATLGVITN